MPDPTTDYRGIIAWCVYDWATSAFNTVISTFVFSVYFARGIYGDETAGSAVWGYAIGLSGLAVAVLSPALGAIADQTGRRKPWLGLFVVLTLVPTALLWFALPARDYVLFALLCIGLANVAFELAAVFYNAMLPSVAPAGMMGRISGWGWGMGYAGGLVCLALALAGCIGLGGRPPLFGLPTEQAANIRATALLVTVWYGAFAVPLFLFTPDVPPTGVTAGQAVRRGLAALIRTVREVRRYREIVLFLIASALYRDGLNTLFAVGGLYAAGTFGMSFEQILLFAIGLNVTAGLGAAGFAFLDDWLGSKPTVLLALTGLLGCGTAVLLVSDWLWFTALALGLGTFVGPAQAASRTLVARMAPPGMETELFGLYALTGRAVSFLGPVLFGLATSAFASQRAGMSTILLLFLAGGGLLLTVREAAPGRATSSNEGP